MSCWFIKQIPNITNKTGSFFDQNNKFQPEIFTNHLMVIFVFVGLMGLAAYMVVFPPKNNYTKDNILCE